MISKSPDLVPEIDDMREEKKDPEENCPSSSWKGSGRDVTVRKRAESGNIANQAQIDKCLLVTYLKGAKRLSK